MPMILTLRFLNSSFRPAIAPSSVVQTGVKFCGWLKRTAQPSPIHSWKLIVPCVVSAVKSGAVSLMRSPIWRLLLLQDSAATYSPLVDCGHHSGIGGRCEKEIGDLRTEME